MAGAVAPYNPEANAPAIASNRSLETTNFLLSPNLFYHRKNALVAASSTQVRSHPLCYCSNTLPCSWCSPNRPIELDCHGSSGTRSSLDSQLSPWTECGRAPIQKFSEGKYSSGVELGVNRRLAPVLAPSGQSSSPEFGFPCGAPSRTLSCKGINSRDSCVNCQWLMKTVIEPTSDWSVSRGPFRKIASAGACAFLC
jgi:hypothetical protein